MNKTGQIVFVAAALGCMSPMAALAQSFEGSISGGVSRISGKSADLGTLGATTNPDGTVSNLEATLTNGFRLTFRMTFNMYRFAGAEVGYAYNRTHLHESVGTVTVQDLGGMAIHQGFGDFLLYATPEGSRIRPFAAGGIQFSNFVPPGASAQYGQGENKFGVNYGAGVKVKLFGPWQVRFDIRQYNMGKPFGLGGSGRLNLNEFSAGVGIAI